MMKMDAEIIGVDVIEKIKSNMASIRPRVKLVIESNARLIEYKSKEKVPVDTGHLKRSITARAENDNNEEISWLIVSDLPYAEAQEFNEWYHHNIGQAHYFRDSMTEVFPKYQSELQAIMRSV